MRKIGYARVSTSTQNLDRQIAVVSDESEANIRKRMRKLRELTELRVGVLWDEERSIWLAEVDWSPFAGQRGEGAAVEASTVKEADKIDA